MSKRIKILYLCPNGYLGGAERFVLEASLSHLLSHNVESEILFFSDGVAVDKAKELGLKYYILRTKFKLRQFPSLIKACLEIRHLIKHGHFTIVHSTMPYSHIVNVISTLFLPLKRIWFQHGPVGGFLDKLASFLPVDILLFNSHYTMDQHHIHTPRFLARPLERIVRIGVSVESVDIHKVLELRGEVLPAYKDIMLLSAGRITDWKGYETSIKAIFYLKDISPSLFRRIRFILIGNVGREKDVEYRDDLVKLVRDLDLSDEVLFLPHHPQIHSFFKACDIFIHSSTIPEPFGLVVAEAMAQGSLVIGSNQGGVQDILHDRKTGFSFDASAIDAPEKLAKLIQEITDQMVKNPESINAIKEEGRKLILDNYSIQQLSTQLDEYYELTLSL